MATQVQTLLWQLQQRVEAGEEVDMEQLLTDFPPEVPQYADHPQTAVGVPPESHCLPESHFH